MSTFATQSALFAPQLALATFNGADHLGISVGKYLNLAKNLEAELNAGELPTGDSGYIETKRKYFGELHRLDAFRNEYDTLKGIFEGTINAEPTALEAILQGVIGNIYQTAEDLIPAEEYRRYTGEDQTPTPPTVTDVVPISSHVSGPPLKGSDPLWPPRAFRRSLVLSQCVFSMDIPGG